MATVTKEESSGDVKWDSLQGVGIVLITASVLLCLEFLTSWLMYDENKKSFGISNENAKVIAAIYGPVLVLTFSALRDSLDKMIVGLQGKKVEWIVFSHRAGAIFHYSLSILGALAPMVALLILSLHKSTVAPEVLIGVAAGIWSVTSGNFIKKYLEPYAATIPAPASPETEQESQPVKPSASEQGR